MQENMDLDVKLWLFGRQGITDEILKDIVKIAGTLPQVLLMILCAIKKQSQQTTSFKRRPQPRTQPPTRKAQEQESLELVRSFRGWKCCLQCQRGIHAIIYADINKSPTATRNTCHRERFLYGKQRTRLQNWNYSSVEQGKETVDLDNIKEIRSALSHTIHSRRERELIDNSDMQDISLADLIPISREAFSLGILNRPRYKVTTS